MKDYDLDASQADNLRSLLGAGRDSSSDWDDSDLPFIFDHMLETRLSSLRRELGSETDPTDSGSSSVDQTVRELVSGSEATEASCMLLKDYAKAASPDNGGVLSKPVATVTYYLAIATALRHGHHGITSLDGARLRSGLSWCLTQDWVPADTRTVLKGALETLSP